VLIFVDLVASIFEIIAMVLHSPIVEFFPFPFIDMLQQIQLIFFAQKIIDHDETWN
jgi:hypothetical protein